MLTSGQYAQDRLFIDRLESHRPHPPVSLLISNQSAGVLIDNCFPSWKNKWAECWDYKWGGGTSSLFLCQNHKDDHECEWHQRSYSRCCGRPTEIAVEMPNGSLSRAKTKHDVILKNESYHISDWLLWSRISKLTHRPQLHLVLTCFLDVLTG